MRCLLCGIEKLSKEFPSTPLTSYCKHFRSHCLRCIVDYVQEYEQCPFEECKASANIDDIRLYESILTHMFPTPEKKQENELEGDEGIVYLVLLNGDTKPIFCEMSMTINQFKQNVEKNYKELKAEKQQLFYEGTEIKCWDRDGKSYMLTDYNIKPGTIINVAICLYSVPDNLDRVIFSLLWGYPPVNHCEFLDASCLVYAKETCKEIIDFDNDISEMCDSAVKHSGDIMDRLNHIGTHDIEVSLKHLPKDVSHLFFVLSSWNSSSISTFCEPKMNFFDARDPFRDLCNTKLHDSVSQQAVVMCYAIRRDATWQIFHAGVPCSGNTDDYSPLERKISTLIRKL